MSYFTTCASYTDLEGKVRISDGHLYVSLEDKTHDVSVSVTLNPMQAIELGKSIINAAKQVRLFAMPKDVSFGGIQMEIEDEDALRLQDEATAVEENNTGLEGDTHGAAA